MAEQLVILEVDDLRTYFFLATSRIKAVSTLDVSIRAQVMNLLKDLEEQ